LGNWDQAIDAAMEGAPLRYSMRSYFSAFSGDPSTELDEDISALMGDATRLQQDMSVHPVLLAADMRNLLAEAERLLGQVGEQPEGCPADPTFMRIITQVIADVMNTFLNKWNGEEADALQMIALRHMVEVGLRAGVLGVGAADAAVGSFLQVKAEKVLQRQFDAVAAQDPMSLNDLSQIAVTATLLGYTFDTGVSGSDICLALGSC
jgi:hypothetical protein